MPLYEYECENGHRFEVIRKFSDPPLERCSICGGPVRKLQSAPAFQLKGSGWYITDYARKDQGKGSGETTKKAAAEGGSSSEKSKSGDKDSAGSGSESKERKDSKDSKDSAKPAESAPAGGSTKTE